MCVCVEVGTNGGFRGSTQRVLASWAGWHHSLWQRRGGRMLEQTAAGSGYRKEWAQGILLHCVSFVVGCCWNWMNTSPPPPPPPPIHTPNANTLSNLYCLSLMLEGLFWKTGGISHVEKYPDVPKIWAFGKRSTETILLSHQREVQQHCPNVWPAIVPVSFVDWTKQSV